MLSAPPTMSVPSSSAAAFWQQARQLPHMNTFNMNNSGAGQIGTHTHMGMHHAHQHHHQQSHDAKMAEKIVSELQV